tara:strand:- start:2862 stop:3641 length:780 start_codon:yes stop_codon:yes gene_type:complete
MSPPFERILNIAEKNYISEPLIVGGIPRDMYLNIPANSDIDLTTNTSDCTRLGVSSAIDLNVSFKVFSDGHVSMYTPGVSIDFSGNFISKKAVSYYEGKNGVIPEDMKEVVSRDFTINTLHKSMLNNELMDKTGAALRDLDAKIIRSNTTPEISFEDDIRRVFRSINFAARLGFEVDASIVDFVRKNTSMISSEMGKALRDAFVTNIVSSSINANSDITIGLLVDMRIMHLIPLVGAYKDELISRRMIAKYLDDASGLK